MFVGETYHAFRVTIFNKGCLDNCYFRLSLFFVVANGVSTM